MKADHKQQPFYPAPELVCAVFDEGVLDPLSFANSWTAHARYDQMLATDRVTFSWNGMLAGAPEYIPHPFTGVLAFMENAVIAPSLGKEVVFTYSVVREGGDTHVSEPLVFRVGMFSEEDLPLPLGANQTLNLVEDSPWLFAIAFWPLVVTGQPYWLKVVGMLPGGEKREIMMIEADQTPDISQNSGVIKVMPREPLLQFEDGSQVEFHFKVNFAGKNDERDAVSFPVATPTLKLS